MKIVNIVAWHVIPLWKWSMGYDLALGYNPYISFFQNILLSLLAKSKFSGLSKLWCWAELEPHS